MNCFFCFEKIFTYSAEVSFIKVLWSNKLFEPIDKGAEAYKGNIKEIPGETKSH